MQKFMKLLRNLIVFIPIMNCLTFLFMGFKAKKKNWVLYSILYFIINIIVPLFIYDYAKNLSIYLFFMSWIIMIGHIFLIQEVFIHSQVFYKMIVIKKFPNISIKNCDKDIKSFFVKLLFLGNIIFMGILIFQFSKTIQSSYLGAKGILLIQNKQSMFFTVSFSEFMLLIFFIGLRLFNDYNWCKIMFSRLKWRITIFLLIICLIVNLILMINDYTIIKKDKICVHRIFNEKTYLWENVKKVEVYPTTKYMYNDSSGIRVYYELFLTDQKKINLMESTNFFNKVPLIEKIIFEKNIKINRHKLSFDEYKILKKIYNKSLILQLFKNVPIN